VTSVKIEDVMKMREIFLEQTTEN